MIESLIQKMPYLICLMLVAGAAWHDVSGFRIPNWIVGAIAVLYPLTFLSGGAAVSGALLHVMVAVGAFGVGFALFAAGYLGAGDGKLIAALALWAGPDHIVTFIIAMALSGGLLSIAIWLMANRALPVWMEGAGRVGGFQVGQRKVPYGLAIACGSAAFLIPLLMA